MPLSAKEMLIGPVLAKVTKVRDGDTLEVRALVWPGHEIRVAVRIRGIDAPELRSRCVQESVAAKQAKSALIDLIGQGHVQLLRISGGKYYGRVLASVINSNGDDVGKALMQRELVRPYRRGRRISWCGT